MKNIIISVIFCACAGTLVSAICPKTKIGKPIAFLCSAVVTAAIISVFHSAFLNNELRLDFPEITAEDYSVKTNSAICAAAEKTVAENLFSVVYAYLGAYPESVKMDVDYHDGNFYLLSADVFIETEFAEGLKKHIYEKTGLDVSVREP